MTYNTLPHSEANFTPTRIAQPWIPQVQSLSFHAYSFLSGLKNEKYKSSESTSPGRTAIGRDDPTPGHTPVPLFFVWFGFHLYFSVCTALFLRGSPSAGASSRTRGPRKVTVSSFSLEQVQLDPKRR